jgi:riboflavin kinase/FMN adenylyltransferase
VQVIRGDGPCPTPLDPSVVTIGAYDGVHLGHQAVIRQVRELAAARGLQTVVVTFDRHPAMVVRPESAPRLLCDLDQKLELLAATGVDATYVVHFDEERASETAASFVNTVLVDCLAARAVVALVTGRAGPAALVVGAVARRAVGDGGAFGGGAVLRGG